MKLNFDAQTGLIPVIIQDFRSLQVLMLGYMNAEALEKTKQENIVTFYSRSKKRLWTKGESSGNFLKVKSLKFDCDQDAILIFAEPQGDTCHKGSKSCFGTEETKGFVYQLEQVIKKRIGDNDSNSYTNKLFRQGMNKVAQKVGEEAVELVIEAKDDNEVLFKDEAADLLYHYLILLTAKGYSLEDIEVVLKDRNRK